MTSKIRLDIVVDGDLWKDSLVSFAAKVEAPVMGT